MPGACHAIDRPLSSMRSGADLTPCALEASPQIYAPIGGMLCLTYGPSLADQFRHAAGYVDKILKGSKPGGLPVEQPTKFEFVIDLKTAKARGLTIPQSLLLRAGAVIQ